MYFVILTSDANLVESFDQEDERCFGSLGRRVVVEVAVLGEPLHHLPAGMAEPASLPKALAAPIESADYKVWSLHKIIYFFGAKILSLFLWIYIGPAFFTTISNELSD